MKLLWFLCLSLSLSANAHQLSEVISIDQEEGPAYFEDASETALPSVGLRKLLETGNDTVITEGRARELFDQLERNPKARMRVAGGKCSYRRSYIQKYLRKLGISSGRLYIDCPSNNGRMRLRDRVTGRRYTFSNFHDTNVVKVQRNNGNGFDVMDVQFQDHPVTLSAYLGEIQASQKLKPKSHRARSDRGYCYWSIR